MAPLYINSRENQLFKRIKKLKERKYREQEKLFIGEGEKFLMFDEKPEYVIINDEKIDKFGRYLEMFNTVVVPEYLYKELSSLETPEGIMGVFKIKRKEMPLEDLVIIDGVQDPGNIGTILRVADAAGYSNILILKGSVDPYNEKSVRGSMGSIFTVNIYFMDYSEALDFLKKNGYNIIVTTLSEDSVDYGEMKTDGLNGFVMGSEGNGVSEEFIEAASQKIKIPIYGSAESLNVGVAAGIILYKAREITKR